MAVTPNLKININDLLATVAKLSTKVLARFHFETMRVLDKTEPDIFVWFRIEARVVLALRALPCHRFRDKTVSIARSCNQQGADTGNLDELLHGFG